MTGLFVCPDCPAENKKFSTTDELESHIAGDHLDMCPYECERCRFAKFPTEYALVQHCKEDHGLREFHIRFKWSEELERKRNEVRLKLRVALGSFASTSNEEMFKATTSNGQGTMVDPVETLNGISNMEELAHAAQMQSLNQAIQNVISQQACSGDQLINDSSSCTAGSASTPCISAGGEISPMDYAADSIVLDYQNLIGPDAEELILPVRKPRDVVTCQLCGLKVSNQRSSLVYHSNTKHIKLNLYQCKICTKTWQTIAKSDVLKHVKAVHGGDESMIIDNRKRLGQQLRLWTAKCFPPKDAKRGRPPLSAGNSPPRNGTTEAGSAMSVLGGVLEGAGLDASTIHPDSGSGESNGDNDSYLMRLVNPPKSESNEDEEVEDDIEDE